MAVGFAEEKLRTENLESTDRFEVKTWNEKILSFHLKKGFFDRKLIFANLTKFYSHFQRGLKRVLKIQTIFIDFLTNSAKNFH